MIEILVGNRNLRVIRRNGRLLASRFDPVQEAENWVRLHSEFLSDVQAVFVLGLGSGYHIKSLMSRTSAKIVVIEPDRELIEAVSSIHAELPVVMESPQSLNEVRSSLQIRTALMSSFVVLTHAPSLTESSLLNDTARFLRAREWGALTWQWRLKGHADLDTHPRVDSVGDKALSIYDLERTEFVQNSNERERLLLKALRELVK